MGQVQGQDQGQGQGQDQVKLRQRSALQQQMVLALTLDLAQITKLPLLNYLCSLLTVGDLQTTNSKFDKCSESGIRWETGPDSLN